MDWSSKRERSWTLNRGDVIGGVYLAMRVMSHRAVLAGRGISPKTFLARFPGAPPSGRRLALEILKHIVAESGPLDKISQQKLDSQIMTLSKLMWSRVERDLHLDKELGRRLLEEMRRNDPLASLATR